MGSALSRVWLGRAALHAGCRRLSLLKKKSNIKALLEVALAGSTEGTEVRKLKPIQPIIVPQLN